jgi:acetyltransferase
MKVVGPVHKTDVGGVVLNVNDEDKFIDEFNRMIKIKDTTAILIQPMLSGIELFVGAKNEERFGHMVMCGLGGIFIEVLKDVVAALTPLSPQDGYDMISDLHSHQMLEGIRGQEPVDKRKFADIISRVSALCLAAPEIFEMDLNPLLGRKDSVIAVDARIRIEK